MPRGSASAPAIEMSNRHYSLLEDESLRHSCGRQMYKRIQIVLRASKGQSNKGITRSVGVSLNTVKYWRNRWTSSYEQLKIFELGKAGKGVSDSSLRAKVLEILSDAPRSGTPCSISMAQKQQIVALACTKPRDHGIEMNEWTLVKLSEVAADKQIVITISSSYVGKILKNKRVATS